MQENNNDIRPRSPRLTIRVGNSSLSFAVIDPQDDHQLMYEPYLVKTGISIAANLREAFKTSPLLLRGFQRVQVVLDTPVMLVPLEEFNEADVELLYDHTFQRHEADAVMHYVLPDLNAVAVFGINKDLKLVVQDHFSDIRVMPLMRSVWTHLHRKSFIGTHRKLYVYFREKSMDIFSFDKNRLKFTNTFNLTGSHDAIYFILYAWKLLSYDGLNDELHLVGDIPDKDEMKTALLHYVKKTYIINPVADFNRAPITQIRHLPYDMMTLFIKQGPQPTKV
ncbi:MAG: DUF3822 family protein [Prevotella sp.]|nr:DUF3822 family protein [Prevotella sp.]